MKSQPSKIDGGIKNVLSDDDKNISWSAGNEECPWKLSLRVVRW